MSEEVKKETGAPAVHPEDVNGDDMEIKTPPAAAATVPPAATPAVSAPAAPVTQKVVTVPVVVPTVTQAPAATVPPAATPSPVMAEGGRMVSGGSFETMSEEALTARIAALDARCQEARNDVLEAQKEFEQWQRSRDEVVDIRTRRFPEPSQAEVIQRHIQNEAAKRSIRAARAAQINEVAGRQVVSPRSPLDNAIGQRPRNHPLVGQTPPST